MTTIITIISAIHTIVTMLAIAEKIHTIITMNAMDTIGTMV